MGKKRGWLFWLGVFLMLWMFSWGTTMLRQNNPPVGQASPP